MVSRNVSRSIGRSRSFWTALKLSPLVLTLALGFPAHISAQVETNTSYANKTILAAATEAPAVHGTPGQNYVFLHSATSEQDEEGEATPGDAQHQNIKMHGHWIIDIKNPDGTLADHRDFHNSLQYDGAEYLLALMAGYWVPSDYEIFLQPSNGSAGPCTPPTNGIPGCVIVRSLATQPALDGCGSGGYYCATGLTTTYTLSFSSASSMVLAGSITATQAGSLTFVSTVAGYCQNSSTSGAIPTTPENISPASCTATPASQAAYIVEISSAGLSNSPISVASGQIIQVTVTISFS